MQSRLLGSHVLPIFMFAALCALGLSGTQVANAQETSTTWDKPQQVARKAKPKRVYRPRVRTARVRPKVEVAPLLTVQYRVLKLRPDGSQAEASVATVFHPGDMLRLGVTANQDGFLYIIHQNEGGDGQIMFPDSRVNDGANFVGKNQEFILPPVNCPLPNPRDCWYRVTNSTEKEYFIIVFSRDQITDLPNQAALSGGTVPKSIIDDYVANAHVRDYKIASRPPNLRRVATPAGPYALWVTNTNREDNEEIILRVPLNKGE